MRVTRNGNKRAHEHALTEEPLDYLAGVDLDSKAADMETLDAEGADGEA
jgi:hypothetical protein